MNTSVYSPAHLASWAAGLSPDYYGQCMTVDGETFVVMETAARLIVGFSAFRKDELTALYIAPDEAGQGLGSMLLRHTERLILERGHRTIRLDASKPAQGFYEQHGYVVTGRKRAPTRGGLEIEVSLMERTSTSLIT